MWNSKSKCEICYKFYDGNINITAVQTQSVLEQSRRKLLQVCSKHLFSELCDWGQFSYEIELPFCGDCLEVIETIDNWNEAHETNKEEIIGSANLFAIKTLRLRNKSENKIIRNIKVEKGCQKIICKICHEEVTEGPHLSLRMAEKVRKNCTEYLFTEIFDSNCLSADLISSLPYLPFCGTCSNVIEDICHKNDVVEKLFLEINNFVDNFTLSILNSRKNFKASSGQSRPSAINTQSYPSTTNFHFESTTKSDDCITLDDSDDECMVMEVLPVAIKMEQNGQDSLVAEHGIHARTQMDDTTIRIENVSTLWNASGVSNEEQWTLKILPKACNTFSRTSPSPKKFMDNMTPKIVIKRVETLNHTRFTQPNSTLMDKTVTPGSSKNTPGPSTSTPINDQQFSIKNSGTFQCERCQVVFKYKHWYIRHMSKCRVNVDTTAFECKTCGEGFSDENTFKCHVESHFVSSSTGASTGTNPKVPFVKKPKLFRCKKCGKRFQNDRKLRIHQRMHENVRPFECAACRKKFVQRNHLLMHVNCVKKCKEGHDNANLDIIYPPSEAAIKRKAREADGPHNENQGVKNTKFSCDLCLINFQNQYKYSEHLQGHYDIASDDIRCDICKKVFSSKHVRNTHMQKIHESKNPDEQ